MRILVVDDDPSVAEMIAEAVRTFGHEALVALDGAEGLRVLESTTVQGVFLDLVMPGLGGLAVLARIRSRYPLVPVVILSAHAGDEEAREAMALGASEVIMKPAGLAQFTEILSRLTRSPAAG
ncbi:MAG TPA: response regulator [Candidatus Dormibacteraeota bacterium]|jgi:two-component system OmpR family response regulator|nr:response regulator [Candidatus Dormibacteraeota bacterium]